MYKSKFNSIVLSLRFSTKVETCTSYIVPVPYSYGHFFNTPPSPLYDAHLGGLFYIGVQMALPFRKDKKSGVIKSALETSCAIHNWNSRPASGNTPKSRKSVLICLESTTLQLGAGGETA
jgi:hypothetical protein